MDSMREWRSDPVVTTIDSIATNIAEIDFPSVTICREQFSLKDPMNYIEKLLNLADANAYFRGSTLAKDFDFLRTHMFDTLFKKNKNTKDYYIAYHLLINPVVKVLRSNNITYGDFEAIMRDKYGSMNMFQFLDYFYKKYNTTHEKEIDTEECIDFKECSEMYPKETEMLKKFSSVYPHHHNEKEDFLPLGTLMTIMMPHISGNFKAVPRVFLSPICGLKQDEEDSIQDLLSLLAQDLGFPEPISLFDLVFLENQRVPWTSIPRVFCQFGQRSGTECKDFWNSQYFSSMVDVKNASCIDYWSQLLTGVDLQTHMHIMKFASHGWKSHYNPRSVLLP